MVVEQHRDRRGVEKHEECGDADRAITRAANKAVRGRKITVRPAFKAFGFSALTRRASGC